MPLPAASVSAQAETSPMETGPLEQQGVVSDKNMTDEHEEAARQDDLSREAARANEVECPEEVAQKELPLGSDTSKEDASQEQPPRDAKEQEGQALGSDTTKEDASQEQPPRDTNEQEGQEETQKTKGRRQSLLARVMAGSQGLDDAKASLVKCDSLIEEAKMRETAAQHTVDEANEAVLACGAEVQELCRVEAELAERLSCFLKRKQDASKNTALKKSELQSQQDLLVLLEMEQARQAREREKQASQENEQAAKRQKIDALQRVLEDAKKTHEEMKERERQARSEMRQLAKESRLGAFGRRQRASQKSKNTDDASPQKGQAAHASTDDAANPGNFVAATEAASASQAVDLVPVKREATQAFGAPRSRERVTEAILIEDSQ